ncbi:MAG: response regulator [Acidobacteria bacterium]|nr:response regulator [Acidobacteriota bacterium]
MTLKIFVADDSETIHKVIRLAFEDTDAVVEFASSGDTALDAIRAGSPDIVLADVCLPGVNGYELCSRMKEIPELAAVPVVLLVGTFEPFDEAEASRVGYAAFLTKPFDTSELVNMIREHVRSENAPRGSESRKTQDSSFPAGRFLGLKIPVTQKTWNSFLGDNRILDLFDAAAITAAERSPETKPAFPGGNAPGGFPGERPDFSEKQLSDEVLDRIAGKVVERMSAEIISEIAWEVVPELSEILIKRSIEENSRPR